MNGMLYAKLNSLDYKYINFNFLNIGPYLRSEKSKRKYSSILNLNSNPFQNIFIYTKFYLLTPKKYLIKNPTNIRSNHNLYNIFVFDKSTHFSDYFIFLKDYRKIVIQLFFNLLNNEINYRYNELSTPYIGVHIRRGDFLQFQSDEHFKNNGNTKTPDFYFIDLINSIRKYTNLIIPVKIFSDGYKAELQNILSLESIELVENNNDMLDLLHLSKSQLIITSAGSTFSYWASFLSNATVLIHKDHIHNDLRDALTNSIHYEGPYVDPNTNDLLRSNLEILAKDFKKNNYV